MDLGKIIIINRMIMELIESKYLSPIPVGYTEPDRRYHQQLDQDIKNAIAMLGSEAPMSGQIAKYNTEIHGIVERLEKGGSHKNRRSPSQVH